MDKQRKAVFFDTSVGGWLYNNSNLCRQEITRCVFEHLQKFRDEYEIFTSVDVIEETEGHKGEKANKIKCELAKLEPRIVDTTDSSRNLKAIYEASVMRGNPDLRMMAAATVNGCSMLLSNDRTHISNPSKDYPGGKTIADVINDINKEAGYGELKMPDIDFALRQLESELEQKFMKEKNKEGLAMIDDERAAFRVRIKESQLEQEVAVAEREGRRANKKISQGGNEIC